MKCENCSGGKHSKVRLTEMAAASAAKLPIFAIGKSAKLRCFKNVKSLPCRYRSQVKSWMNSFEWVKELDKKIEKDNRKVILIVDTCPAHRIIEGLKAAELVFLPPNTTSKIQPIDQGIIRSLKAKYLKNHSKADQSIGHGKNVSQSINFRCDAIINICLVWSIWGNHQKRFRKVGIWKNWQKKLLIIKMIRSKTLQLKNLKKPSTSFV